MEFVKLFKGFPMMILINVVENMFNNHIQTYPAVIRKTLGETHLTLTNLGFFDIKQAGGGRKDSSVINPEAVKPWL